MDITVIAVGRARRGPDRALFDHYLGRLRWRLTLREVEEKRPLGTEALKRSEAELIRRASPDGAVLVALDERGDSLTSRAFAQQIGDWRDSGRAKVAFAIGGADGLDPTLRAQADRVLSLGAMTWPHMLVRALLAEQIYRAEQILSGGPYHRD